MDEGARILVVAGNIATGKTRLLHALSSSVGLPAFPERWEDNPWFDANQPNPFLSQMWFLLAAGANHARMSPAGGVQERCIHENARVFARELLADESLNLLESTYSRLDVQLPDPTLMIYMEATPQELLARIRRRGRVQEQGLTTEYLARLGNRYRAFVDEWARCPVVEIDTEKIDVRTQLGLHQVLDQVKERHP